MELHRVKQSMELSQCKILDCINCTSTQAGMLQEGPVEQEYREDSRHHFSPALVVEEDSLLVMQSGIVIQMRYTKHNRQLQEEPQLRKKLGYLGTKLEDNRGY